MQYKKAKVVSLDAVREKKKVAERKPAPESILESILERYLEHARSLDW